MSCCQSGGNWSLQIQLSMLIRVHRPWRYIILHPPCNVKIRFYAWNSISSAFTSSYIRSFISGTKHCVKEGPRLIKRNWTPLHAVLLVDLIGHLVRVPFDYHDVFKPCSPEYRDIQCFTVPLPITVPLLNLHFLHYHWIDYLQTSYIC